MNQTEYILRGLSGGQLQQLAASLLPRLNYEWDELIHSGNVEGTSQTRKGTPDIWKKTKKEISYIFKLQQMQGKGKC